MRQILTPVRLVWALLALLLPALPAAAGGDTLTVPAPYYHVDAANHLILVNQDVDVLSAGATTNPNYLALDRVYSLTRPLGRISTDSSYRAVAAGAAYTLFFTKLPVVHIDTRYPIVDAPSVYAQLQLTETSGRQVQAKLGIEIRGGSSQALPKKSYELSFWADTTGASSADVTLLGMRTDNKYNLQALYNEPLRFRSKVANALWQEIHQIYYKAQEPEAKNGIAMQYAELFLNGEYRGLYALTERVDRKQLKLKKYNNGITGELYKGVDWAGAPTFSSVPPFDNTLDTWAGFEYKHPEEQIDWTNLYNFCLFVKNSTDANFYANYRQKFHLGNAVDYYLFLNLTRATDNTGKNIYIAKYKQGEPYYYVPWDLDGVFGTDWQGVNTGSVDDILTNGFYQRLNQDCSAGGFRQTLTARWQALRTTVITEQHIMAKFRAEYNYLAGNNAYAREQLVWGGTQQDTTQLGYIQGWVRSRLSYLDGVFGQSCNGVTAAKTAATVNPLLQLYPNPATDNLRIESEARGGELSLRDLSGRVVLQTTLKSAQSQVDVRALRRGLYVVTLKTPTAVVTQKLLLE
ncbi:CotH kinase family protein [Hymenobacter sp. 15J16-1T3B]|uniref:CotH kinase family protein n=1 Tax=Hymenobacter sp. 15J16-1T3B TaxID=2886941 RepID=UPI001D10CB7D|nr:CotH kinase family protein [Hymenobacter sp. 15J16-1T3B]MCC3156212.1 CotH kinase family protein [Hymenobacter sp. 15J16-1T3B]